MNLKNKNKKKIKKIKRSDYLTLKIKIKIWEDNSKYM